MKKNVDLDWELFKMGRLMELVGYRVCKNNWGVEWYSLGDWLKSCGHRICLKKSMNRLWILNNRIVREKIGVFDEMSNAFVSGVCMLGKGGINM